MEKVLLKLARQLNNYDEASLMALWDKYAQMTQQFEPTKRWEEAVLILSFIQSIRWKNQLFNYHWATKVAQSDSGSTAEPLFPDITEPGLAASPEAPTDHTGAAEPAERPKAKVLQFPPRNTDNE